jgi:hypothetical protein
MSLTVDFSSDLQLTLPNTDKDPSPSLVYVTKGSGEAEDEALLVEAQRQWALARARMPESVHVVAAAAYLEMEGDDDLAPMRLLVSVANEAGHLDGCTRRKRGAPSGSQYADGGCGGCEPHHHCETMLIALARRLEGRGASVRFARSTIGLTGHYFVCDNCRRSLREASVSRVVLDAEEVQSMVKSRGLMHLFTPKSAAL